MMYLTAAVNTVIEFLKYLLIFRLIFGLEIKAPRWKPAAFVSGAVIFQWAAAGIVGFRWENIIIFLLGWGIPVFLIEGNLREKLLDYVLMAPGVFVMDMVGTAWIAYVSENTGRAAGILGKCFTFMILGVFAFINKDREKKRIRISDQQYLVAGSGIISCTLLIVGIRSLVLEHSLSKGAVILWYLASAGACGMYLIICIYQMRTASRAEEYKEKNQGYEAYIKFQERQMQEIIRSGKLLRSFKHDVHAHFQVIRDYAERQDWDKLLDYLDAMERNSGVYAVKKYCGNTAIDAVIEEILQKAEEKQIKVKWQGSFAQDSRIETYDLCVMVSNLLTNAVEACVKIGQECTVEAKTYAYLGKTVLSISNPVDRAVEIKDHKLVSTKEDRKNHGFGSGNVKQAVEKYGGTLDYFCEENIFRVEIWI